MLGGVAIASLATVSNVAIWAAVGQPLIPIAWAAIFGSVGGVTLAIAYWLFPGKNSG